MIWEPFVMALVLGIIVAAGLYFAYLWPPGLPPEPGEPGEPASPPAPEGAAPGEPPAADASAHPAGATP